MFIDASPKHCLGHDRTQAGHLSSCCTPLVYKHDIGTYISLREEELAALQLFPKFSGGRIIVSADRLKQDESSEEESESKEDKAFDTEGLTYSWRL